MITKGALDVLLNRCVKIYENGDIRSITEIDKEKILKENSKMADRALRVLAVAYLDRESLPKEISTENIEKELIFVRNNPE